MSSIVRILSKPALSICLYFVLLLFISCLHNKTQEPTPVVWALECPLASSLPDTERENVFNVGGEIAGLGPIEGGKLNTAISNKLNKQYPAAEDVNRIYALVFAGCVRCRLYAEDKVGCAAGIDRIIDQVLAIPKDTDSEAVMEALDYREDLLSPTQELYP